MMHGTYNVKTKIKPSLFIATCNNNYPSARCVSAANHVCKAVDILRKTITSLKQILR